MRKKYIVELPDCYILNRLHENKFLQVPIVLENGDDTVIRTVIPLTPYTDPDLEQVRKEAYDKGYDDATAEIGSDEQAIADKAYKNGLSDAWEAARKIYDISHEDRLEIFPEASTFVVADICDRYSASEAVEKIRQYEQEKEEQITKGDSVLIKSTPEVEILVTYADEEYVSGIALTEVDGNCEIGDQYTNIRISNVEKTGKHYDIVSVLQKMREESNG